MYANIQILNCSTLPYQNVFIKHVSEPLMVLVKASLQDVLK
jgi:hypothetical protein